MVIEELHTDGWHTVGRPAGPKLLMEVVGSAKAPFEMVGRKATTRTEFAKAMPVMPR